MLTAARPLFEHVPVDFGDPVGLAAQQTPGRLSLSVVAYPDGIPDDDPTSSTTPRYDLFVCRAPVVVAVAHATPAFRFPVHPQRALERFHAAREDQRAATLSLYALEAPDAARLLEAIYFQACLKLHLAGTADAVWDMLQLQLERTGCQSGVLELNDFSDPRRPRLHLLDLDGWAADRFRAVLPTFSGRALLYDRARNRHVAADRTGAPLHPAQHIEHAAALAQATLDTSPHALDRLLHRQQAVAAAYAPDAVIPPPLPVPSIPQEPFSAAVHDVAALVAGSPDALLDALYAAPRASSATPSDAEATPSAADVPDPPSPPSEPTAEPEASAASEPDLLVQSLHGLAVHLPQHLDAAFGARTAQRLVDTVIANAGVTLPLPPDAAMAFLAAFLDLPAPRRVLRYRARVRPVLETLAADLHALHAHWRDGAPGHPLLPTIARLWTRCQP
ncbi:MAG: hypothetical protein RhofKO_31980 [Rhodothermales bacterium]